MRVNPYDRELIELTVGLLNRPIRHESELHERWIGAGMPMEHASRSSDRALIAGYLADWEGLVSTSIEPERIELLNAMLQRYASAPTITNHDGSGWHLHFRPDTASLAEALSAATTVALAVHLTAHGVHRLGRCALAECESIYVDHSRPGRQRYCSQPCANRDAVRRHRLRSRVGASAVR